MKWLKDILTDNSGDYDVVSMMSVAAFIVFFALELYQVMYLKQPFDMVNYGIAVAGLLAATGGAYHVKANKEPGKANTQ